MTTTDPALSEALFLQQKENDDEKDDEQQHHNEHQHERDAYTQVS